MVCLDVDYSQPKEKDRQTRVRFAVLPFVGWENYRKETENEIRVQFDLAFEDALDSALDSIGEPDCITTYSADKFHRAIWKGTTGLFLIQQSNYDPQFGAEIHCWIQASNDYSTPFLISTP